MRRAALLALVALAGCQSKPARIERIVAVTEAAPAAPDEKVLIERAGFSTANVGFVVYDLEQRRVARSLNAASPFVPASVAKVPTALLALDVLGPEHRFETTLSFAGKRGGAVWRGDLYLRGTGDPFLTASDLADFAHRLRALGLRRLEGRFRYDDTALGRAPRIHPRHEVDVGFNTAVSALSAEFNRITLKWEQAGAGTLAWRSLPPVETLRFELVAPFPDPGNPQRETFGAKDDGTWLVPGDVATSGSQDLPVRDGARFTAGLLRRLAADAGVELPEPDAGRQPAGAETLHRHRSAPVVELAGKTLEWSNNLMAELLLLASARKLTGRAVSLPEAGALATGYWKKRIPSVAWDGYVMENGSGLATATRVSPEQLLALLRWADAREYHGRSFLSLLPISAWKGTLRERFRAPVSAFRVWAKTGTMRYGSGLAGYGFPVTTRRPFAFVVFIGDAEKRRALDEGVAAPGNEGERWVDRARRLTESLIAKWLGES